MKLETARGASSSTEDFRYHEQKITETTTLLKMRHFILIETLKQINFVWAVTLLQVR